MFVIVYYIIIVNMLKKREIDRKEIIKKTYTTIKLKVYFDI
jgi:hypothetical protein